MIPLVDLRRHYEAIGAELEAAVSAVLADGSFVLGPGVASFEREFACYSGAVHAVGLNSGTSALHLGLLALGVGAGDEVIVPAMTFVASAAAVEYTGARPTLCDVRSDCYTINPAAIEAAITERTKAIMPVHLYGQCADMDAILQIASRHGLAVIEDAAQAHGAEYRGQRAGSLASVAAFSFYPGKNLGAAGEAGAVTTSDEDVATTVRMLRDWGQREKGDHVMRGFNLRMEGIQGAVLSVKLKYLEMWTESRRRIASLYADRLSECDAVVTPRELPERRHVWHVYGVLVEGRDGVLADLRAAEIGAGVHYPRPVHLQACYADLGYREGDFPVAEMLAKRELSLPIFPEMTDAQVGRVCEVLLEAVR